jgi:hypothetical protein
MLHSRALLAIASAQVGWPLDTDDPTIVDEVDLTHESR